MFANVKPCPAFGEQKARIFTALLAKGMGVTPPGWEDVAGPYGQLGHFSVADIDGPEALTPSAAQEGDEGGGEGGEVMVGGECEPVELCRRLDRRRPACRARAGREMVLVERNREPVARADLATTCWPGAPDRAGPRRGRRVTGLGYRRFYLCTVNRSDLADFLDAASAAG